MTETILIVDDEESVRRTFRDWLTNSGWGCRVVAVADAESALLHANEEPIDLAILDWNLGAGNDGLRLLEDLGEFNPDIVAILITGFADRATPLDALRMGVRDYLDKNQDLTRETFLTAVRRQLDRIVPAKRQRQLNRTLAAFREAVEKVLPLVQAAAALNDPVPLPQAIHSLFAFLLRTTHARDGVLLVRHVGDAESAETYRVYSVTGGPVDGALVPFAHSLAASVVSLQEPCVMNRLDPASTGAVELQPFECGRSALLAVPFNVGPGVQVVLELFDKTDGFSEDDRRLTAAAADFGAELLRQALAERQTQRLLVDAVGAALGASDTVAQSLRGTAEERREQPPPEAVLDRLRAGLEAGPGAVMDADAAVRLAEAVRVLAVRHGPAAVRHCTRMVESLRGLLDEVTGTNSEFGIRNADRAEPGE